MPDRMKQLIALGEGFTVSFSKNSQGRFEEEIIDYTFADLENTDIDNLDKECLKSFLRKLEALRDSTDDDAELEKIEALIAEVEDMLENDAL